MATKKPELFQVVNPEACKESNRALAGQPRTRAELVERGLDVDALVSAGHVVAMGGEVEAKPE